VKYSNRKRGQGSPHQAKYYKNTKIELCKAIEEISCGNIKHAVFDHDGTISTLRRGGESVMEPVMVEAIVGRHDAIDKVTYDKVVSKVRDYIDESTGIQTIVQMEALVKMVSDFGIVAENDILDKFGYKQIYNDALMAMVNKRISRFVSGRLDANHYIIKGAVDFLRMLKDKNITVYLASGTDYSDAVNEAGILGYADFFGGGIYGSVDDITKYSKKLLLNRIITDNNISSDELLVIGDGPVEMRECRKLGCIAVGVASDEQRCFGLNPAKRNRLIKAGADIIIPDFSEGKDLSELLFG